MTGAREVVPAGEQPVPGYQHLLPIARFLIEQRGHLPIEEPKDLGFVLRMGGLKCHLTHSISEEDWTALNEHFVIPDNIVYMFGRIRDQANKFELIGHEEITDVDGVIPIDVWIERQRAAGYDFGVETSS